MVSNLSLCVTIGMAICQPNSVSEDITQLNIPYSQVEQSQIEEIMENILAPSYSREIPNLEILEYVQGYYEYVEEQEAIRLAEEEKERQYQEWLNSFDRKDYRQTYYGTFEDEKSVGAGFYWNNPKIENINGVYHYDDEEFGYTQIVAISLNEVLESGQNDKGIWNVYGSIIEMKYPSGEVKNAIILDACSACDTANKIDLWVSNPSSELDIQGVDWKFIRKGWESIG